MQKVEFKTKVNGEELTYTVRMPSGKIREEAKERRNMVFKRKMFEVDENGKNTALLSGKAYNTLKEMGIWTEDKEKRVVEVGKLIDEKVNLLSKGKSEQVPTTLTLREVIIKEIKPLRVEQFDLLSQSKQLDGITVESIASEAEIDYLVCKCTFDDELKPAYSSLEDFYDKADEEFSREARTQLQILMGIYNPNWFNELPENKLLKQYNFIDDNGNYVIDGKLVNSDGKLINEKGFLLNEDGVAVNEYGDPVDDEGKVKTVEFD